MIHLAEYLDSTYLKTPEQSGLSEIETQEQIKKLVSDAIAYHMKLVMIRAEYISLAKEMISEKHSDVLVGTVIDFPMGTGGIERKLKEAQLAIEQGADELDFVIDYTAFQQGNSEKVKEEFIKCTELGLSHQKVVKWIIETAALTDDQIISITKSIAEWAKEFPGKEQDIFVKSSTGFYVTHDGTPNGANPHVVQLMKENSELLPIKAAGGVRTYDEALEMINLGVSRIGTSSAVAILEGEKTEGGY